MVRRVPVLPVLGKLESFVPRRFDWPIPELSVLLVVRPEEHDPDAGFGTLVERQQSIRLKCWRKPVLMQQSAIGLTHELT